MKRFYVILLSGLTLISANSQTTISDAIKTYLTQWHKGEPTAQIKNALLQYNAGDLLSEMERYTADTLAANRQAIYRLLADIGVNLTETKWRKHTVKQLVIGCSDRDGGIVGINLDALTLFKTDDFEPESKYMLSEMAKKFGSHYQTLVKICGWLQITDLIYDFRQMINEKKGSVRDRWAMRLAMARMGDAEMLDYCVQRVKNIALNDDVVYDLVPDIIYTRQKLMFDYLLTLIESDEKNCTSSNPDSDAKIICAFRIIKQVAQYIENFPVETDIAGDMKIQDYDKTLGQVRAWIMENRDKYVIQKEGY